MTFSSSINICWAGLTMKWLCCYLRISWSNFLLFLGGSLRSAAGPWGHKPTPSHWSCPAQAGTLWQRAGGTYYQRDCSVFPIDVTLFVKNCYLIAQLSLWVCGQSTKNAVYKSLFCVDFVTAGRSSWCCRAGRYFAEAAEMRAVQCHRGGADAAGGRRSRLRRSRSRSCWQRSGQVNTALLSFRELKCLFPRFKNLIARKNILDYLCGYAFIYISLLMSVMPKKSWIFSSIRLWFEISFPDL